MGGKNVKKVSKFHMVSRCNLPLALLECWQTYSLIEMEGSRQVGKGIILTNPTQRERPPGYPGGRSFDAICRRSGSGSDEDFSIEGLLGIRHKPSSNGQRAAFN